MAYILDHILFVHRLLATNQPTIFDFNETMSDFDFNSGESISVPSPGNIWSQRTYLGEPRPADILQVRTDRPNAVGVRHEDWSIARLLFRLLPGKLV